MMVGCFDSMMIRWYNCLLLIVHDISHFFLRQKRLSSANYKSQSPEYERLEY